MSATVMQIKGVISKNVVFLHQLCTWFKKKKESISLSLCCPHFCCFNLEYVLNYGMDWCGLHFLTDVL